MTKDFIILCWIIFFTYWIVSAFSVKRTVRGSGWQWRVFFVAIFVLVYILNQHMGFLVKYSEMVFWPQSMSIGILADALVLVGLVIMIWARRILGGNWSAGVVLKENHELIERGPYAYVRHPIYSGGLLMIFGTAVWYGQAGGFEIFLLVLIGFSLKALSEEHLLTKHFGQKYLAYTQRTKRLIPFIF